MAETQKDLIWKAIVETAEGVLADEGRAPVPMTPETSINNDLEISSLTFVHLLLGLEDKLGQAFEFEKIALRDGIYRTDLTLGKLWEFIVESDAAAGISGAPRPS